MKKITYKLPKELSLKLETYIQNKNLSPAKVAKAIKQLSDRYTQKDRLEDIWRDKNNQLAYLSYFLPLNLLRLQAVLREANDLELFSNDQTVIDYGSGCGTSFLALEKVANSKQHFVSIEQSADAIELQKMLLQDKFDSPIDYIHSTKMPEVSKYSGERSLICSYSINELDVTSTWFKNFDHLILVEPATQFDGRKLLELRAKLIELGFSILAPCLHQSECPMLKDSKKDWCHSRIFVELPSWYYEIEKHLPMKNRTLTYSYLIASKKKKLKSKPNLVRIIGDTQKEKGKTKQMICRNSNREFFSWLKKEGDAIQIPRNQIVEVNGDFEIKGNELRIGNSFTATDLGKIGWH